MTERGGKLVFGDCNQCGERRGSSYLYPLSVSLLACTPS